MQLWPDRGLWRHRDFLNLWAAQIVSAFGSRITRTAMPALAILLLGAPDGEVALLGALSVAPAILTGLVASRFIDRARKRPLLIAADLARAGLVASIPAAAWLGLLSMAQLYVVAFLAGAAAALFQIADQSFLPSVVGRHQLAEGNTKLAATESIAEIGGPGMAGFLIQIFTAPVAILIDALSFLWSALFLMRIRVPETVAAPAEAPESPWAGLGAIWGNAHIRPIFLSELIGMTGWGFFAALYMLFALRTLGLGIEIVGLIIGVGGIGAFVGAIIVGPAVRALGVGPALLLFIALNMGAAILLPLSLQAGPVLAIAMLAAHQLVGDAFGSAFSILGTTLRQTAAAPALLGRVNAAFVTMHAVSLLTGSLIAVPLASWLGVLPAVAAGVAIQLCGILPILSPRLLRLQRLDDADAVAAFDPPLR
ncbi:MAG: MFS transporter [Alphaproteobacteria bacterium]|nr:MFS transporter [Alphaproteobacteria bacterium]